ncbi:nitrate reductase subunit beta [Alicyclobacillus hesperidum subsp. aegles]|uniref:nitrate reductase subunit beta n=1 Tax=Alicyclobacillus hesperidum TaxID=89784 RepID=UPI0007193A2E|nr:nitrate reductase subunit beta [Alicyclobacillus hesperidum]KRW92461.1 nitrate reductase [Alicyclobacillus tengchongensis]GLG01162.1 nitrate reductase subunit beta [Alicyclobacillus hesperidum subsp. aegles]
MKIKAQVAMVMNLDKCIGCHTCSVTCKNTWTNRPGVEYAWFNNVETRPGPGYPKRWEDQEKFKGGWRLKNGKLQLRAGGAVQKLANIFHNPDLPTIDDYYEPWTYDYENLIDSPKKKHQPVARPRSLLTGDFMNQPVWGPNWDDDLAGGSEIAPTDPNFDQIEQHVRFAYEQTFMMYLPRICEHCLNPACVAACPSGAIYKRDEDGIVLVDQNACRGWRFCVSACPYKKVYFNWNTHKAEKCHFCYPRLESGLPTICSETCVGRIRYLGVLLYDADKVRAAASVEDPKDLYSAQLEAFLDPFDPEVIEKAKEAGISDAWIESAQRSPVYKMAVEWKIALPLHPEFRTLPMVWYVPPLSPMMSMVKNEEHLSVDGYLPTVDQMRIPVEYLASILTAGDVQPVRKALLKLASMRAYMRAKNIDDLDGSQLLKQIDLTTEQVQAMARLFGVAKYDERFVIPTANRETTPDLGYAQGACSLEDIAPPEGIVSPVGAGQRGEF